MRESMDDANLQAVVDGIGSGLIEGVAAGFGIDSVRLNFVLRGAQRRAIRRAQDVEIGALGPGVGEVENPVLRKGRFRSEVQICA